MARHDVRISSIVIVGHSLGAGAAVGLAEELQRAGVRVALVVTFAPIVRTAIPSNVQQLKNYYLSNGMGITVERGDHYRGSSQNVDQRSKPKLGHASLARSPAIHKQVL